ncbi:MAG: lipid-A-disaccharide synthase [Planctomycetes bacterium]|nr:lipid-A-disaccharide synthase [Planctomycetota bacterium]
MRIFYSVGEPSGDVHGANLIRALGQRRGGIESVGFGGDRMAEAGCRHLFNLCNHAVMGFTQVISSLPRLLSLVSQADRYFRHQRPDAVVLIDYPGFNWWIARRAHFHRIPVFYFVPPQLWAWAGWRVSKVRRHVDHVLCSLPFEETWFRERGVAAEYVGHPFFDELPRQRLDSTFMEAQSRRGGTIIGLLPGSRTHEVELNFLSQLRAAQIIHRKHPQTRFLVACYKEQHLTLVEAMRQQFAGLPIEVQVQKTPEIIELSKACISVSGSVSLELLYRAKPTAIVFRLPKLAAGILYPLVKVKFITLVNLLADRMIYPEFVTLGCPAEGVAGALLNWLDDESAYAGVCRELLALRERVAMPGACARAAGRILEVVERRQLRAG